MKFSYRKNLVGSYFPIIPVRLHFKNKLFDTSALIDSGATISIMQENVAKDLGIDIEKGTEIFIGGVGGRIKGYVHEVIIEIAGNNKFKLQTIFSREYHVSFNLLGRNEFFEKFKITFDEKNKVVELI